MAQIPEDVVESARERVDIVDLIGRHVTLKRVGKQWRGLCPFHGEKTPSFYVDPQRKSFKCFGCGEWGDAIDFLRKSEGKSFVEAVRAIAESLGIAVPAAAYGGAAAKDELGRRDQAFAILRLAKDVYRQILLHAPAGEQARAYQLARHVPEDLAQLFALGYAPHPNEGGWDTLTRALVEAGHALDVAEEIGLVVRSERTGKPYDRFRGRWMFPIMLPGGAVAGFSARILPAFERDDAGEKVAKYINSPESLVYKKSELLFGLHAASPGIRGRSRVIVVEGNVDVLAMHRAGFSETVAPLGTALTQTQCERLFRYTDTAILCFDGDKAGSAAMWKAVPLLLAAGFDVRVAPLPEGEDPDSVAQERLQALLARPMPALMWVLRRMVAAGATASPDAKDRALRAFVPLLRQVLRPEVRADYVELAANLLQVAPLRVSNLLALAVPTNERRGPGESVQNTGQRESRPEPPRPAGNPAAWTESAEHAPWPEPEMLESGSAPAFGPSGHGPQRPWQPQGTGSGQRPWQGGSSNGGGQRPWQGGEGPSSGRQTPWGGGTGRDFASKDRPFQRTNGGPGGSFDRRPGAGGGRFGGGSWGDRGGQGFREPGPTSQALQPHNHSGTWPAGQQMLVALLIDRPELASLADQVGIRTIVRDPRFAPILNAVLDAALQGERQPSEGEVLALVDGAFHRDLHERLFTGNYLEIEDPRQQLEEGVRLCARMMIDEEIAQIDRESQAASDLGDDAKLRELHMRKVELRRRQLELRVFQSTV